MARRGEWQVILLKDGLYDVEHDRRIVLAEVPEERAWRYVKEHISDSEKAYEVEDDGYRIDVTKRLARMR